MGKDTVEWSTPVATGENDLAAVPPLRGPTRKSRAGESGHSGRDQRERASAADRKQNTENTEKR